MQLTIFDAIADSRASSASGKMCPASSPTATTRSDASLPRWLDAMPPSFRQDGENGQTRVWLLGQGARSLGGSSMPNTSAWPNDASVCSLSSVLWAGPVPMRYFLSAKACAGILRRAEARGKRLPGPLLRALLEGAGIATTPTPPTT